MHRSDILLGLAVVAIVLAFVFAGPAILDLWRTSGPPTEEVADAANAEPPVIVEDEEREAPMMDAETAAESERVNGMLMLYQACANRFDGFDAQNRDVVEHWKAHHDDLLGQGAGVDFHIVLADPDPSVQRADEGNAEERGLCDRNIEAMRSELPEASPAQE